MPAIVSTNFIRADIGKHLRALVEQFFKSYPGNLTADSIGAPNPSGSSSIWKLTVAAPDGRDKREYALIEDEHDDATVLALLKKRVAKMQKSE